jgi:hypothetical protein
LGFEVFLSYTLYLYIVQLYMYNLYVIIITINYIPQLPMALFLPHHKKLNHLCDHKKKLYFTWSCLGVMVVGGFPVFLAGPQSPQNATGWERISLSSSNNLKIEIYICI